MNINAISAATPKFQSTKPAKSVNFTGLEKAAGVAGEAAANAANKAGVTDKVIKVLSAIVKGLKTLGHRVLKGFKKLIYGPHEINIGKGNTITYEAKPKGASTEEFRSAFNEAFEAFEAFGAGSEGSSKVIIRQTGSGISIAQINGKTYVNGKLFTPGDKLPDGVTYKNGTFYTGNGKHKFIITQTGG